MWATRKRTKKKPLTRKSEKREIGKRQETFCRREDFVSLGTFAKMLTKAPKLKQTIKTKAKSNINIRPASEAMVGNRRYEFRLFASFVANFANMADFNNELISALFPQIELLTLLFLSSLAEEAKAKAFEEKSATIRAQHVRAVSKVRPDGSDRGFRFDRCSSSVSTLL